AALLAGIARASAIDGIVAKEDSRLPWAPSRDDALLVDHASSVRQASGESDESVISRSPRLAQRPRSLSRPAPWDGQMYLTDAAAPGESLPSITGTPMSPEGLPVPPGGYYEEGDPTMPGVGWRGHR